MDLELSHDLGARGAPGNTIEGLVAGRPGRSGAVEEHVSDGTVASFRGAALAGIIGGALWLGLTFRGFSAAESPFGLSRADLGSIAPVAALLLWLLLRGVHRAHVGAGRSGRLELWTYRAAALGYGIEILGLAVERWLVGEPSVGIRLSPFAELARLLVALGYLVTNAGLAGYGLAAVRERLLPWWGRAMPLVVSAAFWLVLLINSATAGRTALAAVLGSAVEGLGCLVLGLALLQVRVRVPVAQDAPPISWREIRAALLSRATLISGLIAVAIWSLAWSWLVGVLVVLLLYVHELGHVLAAFVRRVRVRRAPFFLPGFGAFVETAPGATAWDDVWISLGGPLVGGAGALLVKIVGVRAGNPALAQAGEFALLVNLANLAPFSPLDGGRVALKTGWLGLALTVGLGGLLLLQGLNVLLAMLVVFGGLQAVLAVRRTRVAWSTHLGVMAVYLGCILALTIATVASGRVAWLPSGRPAWLPGLGDVFNVVFLIYIGGFFALPYAWRREQSALVRYGILALLGWPRFLLARQVWLIPTDFGLFLEAIGVAPGAAWVERYASYLARRGDPAAGAVSAYVFDCLVRLDRGDADALLRAFTPRLREAGPAAVARAYETLLQLGYETSATAWLEAAGRGLLRPEDLAPSIANFVAWSLFLRGQPESALPYATAAVDGEPDNAASLDTLGQVLLAIGAASEAESVLRAALARKERDGTRVALARALAAQGRAADAAAEAERVLNGHRGPWPEGEPDGDQVRAWLAEWRPAAGARAGILRSNVASWS